MEQIKNEVSPYSPKHPMLIEYLKNNNIEDLSVGDVFIDENSYEKAVKIVSFEFDEKSKIKYPDANPYDHIYIHYVSIKNFECTEWDEKKICKSINSFKNTWIGKENNKYSWIKTSDEKTIKDYMADALDVINGKVSVQAYASDNKELSSENAIMAKGSKESLIAMQKGIELQKNKAEIIKACVGLEMERRKRELDKIRNELGMVLKDFQVQINRIMKVITVIELYLGIDEELFQIQDGLKAPQNTPISFRQAVLYMDEEMGIWKDGGLDFRHIEFFDEWLIKDNNFKRLLPEEKGMVVFRPRRYGKEYSDPIQNAEFNNLNLHCTYLLIRNGDCLYRVYTENITIFPRLFPKRLELQELLSDLDSKREDGTSRWENYEKERKQIKIEDEMYNYRKRAILMQGLIDRTEVFHPLPTEKVNIFNMEDLDGKVNFIYDDEAALPSGRKIFSEWKGDINSKIKKGSRILLTGIWGHGSRNYSLVEEYEDRLYKYYQNKNSIPPLPKQGTYEVEEYIEQKTYSLGRDEFEKEANRWTTGNMSYEIIQVTPNGNKRIVPSEDKSNPAYIPFIGDGYLEITEDKIKVKVNEKHLTILHNPKDTTYSGWGDYEGKERSNRIRFRIFNNDDFILNYDQIDLNDIDFYLTDRVDRPNYLTMMPVLENIKRERTKEINQEMEFSKFVFGRNHDNFKDSNILEKRISECIDWWKFKNEWKRPISKDDTLALRMIERRINSKNYDNLTKLED